MSKQQRIHIKGGRVIDPANNIDAVQDIWIADGKIAAIGNAPDSFTADQTINADNNIVCPGLIDLCARTREPGLEHKGNIASESRAAAMGGISTMICPPDTNPIIDSAAVVELIHHQAKTSRQTRVLTLGALTRNLDGEHISEMHTLKQAGVVGLSNANRPITNSLVQRRAFEYAATHDMTVFIRPDDPHLSMQGCAHEGAVATRLGLPSIPEAAETVAMARDLELIAQTGARVHFSQLSSARAVDMLESARNNGLNVSADVAVHQLYLSEIDIRDFDSDCNVIPPLRSQRDRDGLREGVIRGTISAICSDHQPHEPDAKQAPFADAEPGISGLDTLLTLVLRLSEEGLMSLSDAIARLTSNPASILGLPLGQLAIGNSADICIIDPNSSWFASPETFNSRGHNSPFMGWEMRGQVQQTLVNGRLVFNR